MCHMDGIEAPFAKDFRRIRGETLVQKKAPHATQLISTCSSSTIAAAYSKTCCRSSGSRNGYSENKLSRLG